MAKQLIDIGVEGNDGTGDSIRESFRKVNENFNELYAVFGIGGQIGFVDLADTPNDYSGNENKIPVVKSDGTGIEFRELASNNALNGGVDSVDFDYSVDGKLIITQGSISISSDVKPSLGAPLDATTQAIANVSVSQEAVDAVNAVHGTSYTLADLVINKGYADQNYLPKTIPGSGARLGDEPETVSQYTITADSIFQGKLRAVAHGLTSADTGTPYIFNSTGTDPSGVTTGDTVYVRAVDPDNINLYETAEEAINNTAPILLVGGTGTFSITDAAYDSEIPGNWLSNVALPRKSVVRRQGDTMEGVLTLSDHPGDLAGTGTPKGSDDLQAATKLYVDNSSATSLINLYVSSNGDDKQQSTPTGLAGRNKSYAYKTINQATRRAEEIIEASPYEAGPYAQTITYGGSNTNSTVNQYGFYNKISNREDAKVLIEKNKNFIAAEVIAYLEDTYPNIIYNPELFNQDIKYILDSVSLDIQFGNNANELSVWTGKRFFNDIEREKNIFNNLTATLAGIDFAKSMIVNNILDNTAVSTAYQSRYTQYIDGSYTPDAAASNAVSERFANIVSVITDGVLNAPTVNEGSTIYKISISNGGFGNVDQGLDVNTDIIPGKILVGKNSGAKAVITKYRPESGSDPVDTPNTDEIEVRLLEPVEFENGEELEYGFLVKEKQVSIFTESGIYYEDFPIRIPENVSVLGDEYKRTIVRPSNRESQSTFADLFFYRDAEFDGLVLGNSSITEIDNITGTGNNTARGEEPDPTPGDSTVEVYNITETEYTTSGAGSGAIFTISVFDDGSADIAITSGGENFLVGDFITIPDSEIGNRGGPNITFSVKTTSNAKPYVNAVSGNTDGYFGFHYLKNPDSPRSTGSTYSNAGGWTTAALILRDNKEFIKEQVKKYVENTYPLIVPPEIVKNVGIIVDAYADDLVTGDNEKVSQAQGNVYSYAIDNSIGTETLAGYNYIKTICEKILIGEQPSAIYGTGLTYPQADLYNGSSLPNEWESGITYKKDQRIKRTNGITVSYYSAKADHTSSSTFDVNEISTYWNQIVGPVETVENFDNTISYAFDNNYNPPLRNDQLDVFLLNNASLLKNITVQGHGGFVGVLDPEGQIITKNPKIESCESFTKITNKQEFRGGVFVDAFCGNNVVQVTGKVSTDPFRLSVVSLGSQSNPQGLFVRKPKVPCVFYIDGKRFQVNQVEKYDQDAGTAELILDKSSNESNGFTGITGIGATGVDLDSASVLAPIQITLQTSGSRSITTSDFTQVNDLGYGLIAANGSLIDAINVPTYYCWTGYYSKNGGNIRSMSGKSSYGQYGLVAEGADPNEIPDNIELLFDMVQPAKTVNAEVLLRLNNAFVFAEGDLITQKNTYAQGFVSIGTGIHGNTNVYLTDVTGTFDTANELEVTDSTSTVLPLGATSIPREIELIAATNVKNELSLFAYDFKNVPTSAGEFDIYHSIADQFSLYETTSTTVLTHRVSSYNKINTDVPTTETTLSGSNAEFILYKTKNDGYLVSVSNRGSGYAPNDTFIVSGNLLGGQSTTHDATITVDSIDTGGEILTVTVTGTAYIDPATPVYDNRVYALTLNTTDANYVQTGLIENVEWGTDINHRQTTDHYLTDISDIENLKSKSSTAVLFNENPEEVYRSISYETTNIVGEELAVENAITIFSNDYDYISITVEETYAQQSSSDVWEEDSSPVGLSGTLGASIGDTTIAISATISNIDIPRLNNNAKTPENNRPVGWSSETLTEAPIFVWGGKKYYVFNYRTVGSENVVEPNGPSNVYALVDIQDAGDEINQTPSVGLSKSLIQGTAEVSLYAGLKSGAGGTITVNVSTCRTTSHDFLNIGSGSYNATNYPNVIFGESNDPDQTKETEERVKGRVYYVSTDQDGIFRVGEFFNVNQNTGDITFKGSIALSGLNGIGFRRGVVVNEFSTDTSFADNAIDTVPTENATKGYINRRLGFDEAGNSVGNIIGPGVLSPNGSIPLSDNLNAANNTIINLKNPQNSGDASNKAYVDETVNRYNELSELRDVETNNVAKDQVLVTTGYKKIILGTPTSGSFNSYTIGTSFSGSVSGATGTIVDRFTQPDIEGTVLHLIYTPGSGTFQAETDNAVITGIASAPVVDGPSEEWANGVWSASSDIQITSSRQVTQAGGIPSARYTELDIQYKPNSISNSDINASASISQSKLNINTATTRASSSGISYNDLGLSSFDSANFDVTSGWVSLKSNGIALTDIAKISSDTVLGNSTGSTANVSEISFSTIISEGGGVSDSDFISIISSGSDPGEALIKTGTGAYGISNVSTTGEPNSIVKTNANGDVQANSLILGGNSNYQILSLSGTTLSMKTPAQGTILTATGATGNITVNFPENVDIGATGVSQSSLQGVSSLSGEKYLGVDWIYTSFIEATGERGAASTGIAIGANTGKTIAGEIAIVTADSGSSSSLVPFKFSSTGAVPDIDNLYDIGSASYRYKNIHASTVYAATFDVIAADLAENYLADNAYEPGTVLVFGGENEVTVSNKKSDTRVAGVVTTNPATIMNSALQGENVTAIALQGRVPCKVVGRVEKGDILVTSGTQGYAMVDNEPKSGTIIGKALENKNDTEKGIIEVAVGRF